MDKPKKYQRNPTPPIEAIQWTGDNERAITRWIADRTRDIWFLAPMDGVETHAQLYIAANDAWVSIDVDSWILMDKLGCYPHNAELFGENYTEVTA